MIIRACATETNSILFDLSPSNIDGTFPDEKGHEKLIASVFVTAKEY